MGILVFTVLRYKEGIGWAIAVRVVYLAQVNQRCLFRTRLTSVQQNYDDLGISKGFGESRFIARKTGLINSAMIAEGNIDFEK